MQTQLKIWTTRLSWWYVSEIVLSTLIVSLCVLSVDGSCPIDNLINARCAEDKTGWLPLCLSVLFYSVYYMVVSANEMILFWSLGQFVCSSKADWSEACLKWVGRVCWRQILSYRGWLWGCEAWKLAQEGITKVQSSQMLPSSPSFSVARFSSIFGKPCILSLWAWIDPVEIKLHLYSQGVIV